MANVFLVAGGTGNWNSTTNWSASSGGSSGASFPVAGDVVAFDSGSANANMTVNVPSACASLIMSGTYAGTLTFNDTLTLTSTCTFLAGCTIAGTAGTLICNGSATITSGTKILTCALSFLTNATTFTLADNWSVNGLVTATPTSGSVTLNGNQITCSGGFTNGASTGSVTGTTKLVLAGGTWQHTNGANATTTNNIDLAGNVTVSGAVKWGATSGTLRYLSGTITTTGSTVTSNVAASWDTAGVTWANLSLMGTAVTYTLTSALAWSGTLTLANASTITFAGAALSGTGSVLISGASTITLNNTGGLVTTGTLFLGNAVNTFAGNAGFTVGTLTTVTLTASRTHTLTFGNTYTVTTSLSNVGTAGGIVQSIVSSSPGNKVVLTVQAAGGSDLIYCNPTDIDSSGGIQIVTARGVITTSLNWLVASNGFIATGGGAGTKSIGRGGLVNT